MGSPHKDGSQGKLHGLFKGFSSLVATRLAAAIQRLLDNPGDHHPIRILDIGAGQVPYQDAFNGFQTKQYELVFLDQDQSLPAELGNKLPNHRWVKENFFKIWPSFTAANDDPQRVVDKVLGGKFDIVICAASLHELYYDAVTVFGQPIDFHCKFFRFAREHLLRPHGLLLVADYVWPGPEQTRNFWKIKAVQLEAAKHADPPWAFCSVSGILESAKLGGLHVIESSGQGLHDDLTDTELANKYIGLTLDELQTLRTRYGFVAIFAAAPERVHQQHRTVSETSWWASRYIRSRAEAVFAKAPSEIDDELNNIFTLPIRGSSTSVDGMAPLCHLVHDLRLKVEKLHPTFSVLRGVLEVWANLGLKVRDGAKTHRFVPELPTPWLEIKQVQAGVLSSDLLKPSDEKGRPYAGRIAIPYKQYLTDQNLRTLYQWFTELHSKMQAIQSERVASSGNHLVRSLTMLAQDQGTGNSDTTGTSLSLAGLWGNEKKQAESGHYLVILPSIDGARNVSASGCSFVDQINACLARIEKNVADSADRLLSLPTEYEPFLHAVFYRDPASDREMKFDEWWMDNSSPPVEFPSYRAYSTMVLGCDGLSDDPPDSLMFFSTLAIPPDVLEAASEDLATVCRQLSSLESKILIKTQASAKAELEERARQHRDMVSSFGHDGKRPASTIELLLRSESPMAVRLARMLSCSLVFRLEAFSSLLNENTSIEDIWVRLQRENARATSWTTLRAIWEAEALSVLLRILVDGSGFRVIRKAVFGANATIDGFEAQFEPLVTFLSNSSMFDIKGLAKAVSDTWRNFERLQPGFTVSYNGPEIRLPYALRGNDGRSAVPLAATSLSFLISEMLFNNAKYQWPSLKPKLELNGIHLRLLVSRNGDTYNLDLLSQPTMSDTPDSNLVGDDLTITGLVSLSMVAQGLGVNPVCKPIHVNGELKGEFPFPENCEWEFDGRKQLWSTYSLKDFRQLNNNRGGQDETVPMASRPM